MSKPWPNPAYCSHDPNHVKVRRLDPANGPLYAFGTCRNCHAEVVSWGMGQWCLPSERAALIRRRHAVDAAATKARQLAEEAIWAAAMKDDVEQLEAIHAAMSRLCGPQSD